MKIKTVLKHIKRSKKKATALVVKKSRKRILKKKQAQKLLRAFVVLVLVASTGSLVYAVSTTKPTVDVTLRPTYKTRSITIDASTGTIRTGTQPDQVGRASWYALGLPAPDSHTCASRDFPRGTYLHVTNLRNYKTVVCLVNDYGPQAWTNRVIDLSRGSFSAIDNLGSGTLPAEIRVVPAPPTSLSLTFPSNFSKLTGYSLCTLGYDSKYCENNRQKESRIIAPSKK